MIGNSWTMAVASVGVACAVSTPVYAGNQMVTMKTKALVPVAGGYLNCQVQAKSDAPMGIVANVVATDGTDVTEFSSGWRVSPAASEDGLYGAEETAGSLNSAARACEATVVGARRKDIDVSLTSYDATGNPVATVGTR